MKSFVIRRTNGPDENLKDRTAALGRIASRLKPIVFRPDIFASVLFLKQAGERNEAAEERRGTLIC
jgi:hypothetical protein